MAALKSSHKLQKMLRRHGTKCVYVVSRVPMSVGECMHSYSMWACGVYSAVIEALNPDYGLLIVPTVYTVR